METIGSWHRCVSFIRQNRPCLADVGDTVTLRTEAMLASVLKTANEVGDDVTLASMSCSPQRCTVKQRFFSSINLLGLRKGR